MFKAVGLPVLFAAMLTAPAFAQTVPVWYTPADSIAVLSIGTNHDFAYAIVRDNAMRGHNTYVLTVGAHIGKLKVVAISANGVTLSNGRVLANPTVATESLNQAPR